MTSVDFTSSATGASAGTTCKPVRGAGDGGGSDDAPDCRHEDATCECMNERSLRLPATATSPRPPAKR